MIAWAVAAARNVLGVTVMLVGWFLVLAGQLSVILGFGLLGLVAIGSLDLPTDIVALAGDWAARGVASVVGGLALVYVIGPRIGTLRPHRLPRPGSASNVTA